MCGRYASTRSSADLAALFEAVDSTAGGWRADYNIAPTDPVAMVRRAGSAARVLTVARWGLVPSWSRDPAGAARMINARAETVATTRAFADSFAQRRCLVPADGWYEWRRLDGVQPPLAGSSARQSALKQPYFMTRRDGGVLAFGGIWSTWGAPGGRLLTLSIVTLPAQGDLVAVHDRMPLVLEPTLWWSWLSLADASALLGPPGPAYLAGLELRPVSAAVGDVHKDGPDLVRALTPAPSPALGSTMDLPEPTLF